jgi:glutamate racemase
MKIGIFDSGLGGLSILHAIREQLPEYDYMYYGDTAHLPYGDKTEEEILALTSKAVHELFSQNAVLIIIACNTASAETLRVLQDTMLTGKYTNRRILGVIIPTIEEIIASGSQQALLIGTTRTVDSKKYDRELEKRNATNIEFASCATPELVPLIESGDSTGALTYLENILAPRVGEVDTLILGCTHYTVLKKPLRERFKNLQIISQDEIIPVKLEMYLEVHSDLREQLTRNNSCIHIITGEEPGRINCARE